MCKYPHTINPICTIALSNPKSHFPFGDFQASSAFPESHFCFPHSQPRSTPRVRANRVWRASDSKGGARRIDSSPQALQGSMVSGLSFVLHFKVFPCFLCSPPPGSLLPPNTDRRLCSSGGPRPPALTLPPLTLSRTRRNGSRASSPFTQLCSVTIGSTCQGLEDLPGDLHHIEASTGADPDHVLEALGDPDVVVDVLGQGSLAQPRHAVDGHNVRPSRPSQLDDAPEQLQPIHGGKPAARQAKERGHTLLDEIHILQYVKRAEFELELVYVIIFDLEFELELECMFGLNELSSSLNSFG
ncbi:hypothetical protein Taro_036779 [Colocasia esculenta]|uniref:Uncharacterized protein n=1 Tax=Colocasia esculenta TaxID=4460 RepID=A0A843WIT5_COLES|nr:hypothetical protein [Colocasia esculenta]